jgi:hypothetical protein
VQAPGSDPGAFHENIGQIVGDELADFRVSADAGDEMRGRWQSGYEDTRRTLRHQKWLTMPPQGVGIVVHDVHREED